MNRNQRRSMDKKDYSSYMNTPCTITEAVQIARGVAEDVVSDYNKSQSTLQISISLQIEILKDIVIKAGLIDEENFRKMYMEKAEEFNRLQQEAFSQNLDEDKEDNPKMQVLSNDIEVVKE